jgi:uncharacterized BrkB/YihY/UPF0761 family membrane protein
MKTLKFVSYTALAVLLILIGVSVSIPFQFPGDSVAWDIVISADLLLAILCALLFMLPRLKKDTWPKVTLGAVLVFVIFTIVGWTPWLFMIPFIVAIFGIYLASLCIRT